MSGRLIILPKKKWNVWNRDNVERVQRDERLHREAQEVKAEKQRAIDQEKRLDLLRERKRRRDLGIEEEIDAVAEQHEQPEEEEAAEEDDHQEEEEGLRGSRKGDANEEKSGQKRLPGKEGKKGGKQKKDAVAEGSAKGLDNKGLVIPPDKKGYIEGKHHEGHVHLFDNVIAQIAKKAKNEEYEKEKAEKELKKKRAEGVAPWGFDDVKAPKQWYECAPGEEAPILSGRGGHSLKEDEAKWAKIKAEQAKDKADPATLFMSAASSGISSKQLGKDVAPPTPMLLEDDHLEQEEARTRSKKRKKKEKKRKKDKKKKKSSGRKERKERRSPSPSTSSSSSCSSSDASSDEGKGKRRRKRAAVEGKRGGGASMEELRRRRLEREQVEHRKAVQLLAQRQIAGLSYPGGATPLIDAEKGPDVELDDRKREYNSVFFRRRR